MSDPRKTEDSQGMALRSGEFVRRPKSFWRRDGAITHADRGHGVITNFVGCKRGCANVYFYEGEYVTEIPRYELNKAAPDWHDHSPPNQ